MQPVRFLLNGVDHTVAGVDPHTTLLQYLRGRGLVGTKEGCAEGECGACAVALVESGQNGRPAYRAVNSCLLLLPMLHGQEVYTVEGLAGTGVDLHPVQAALAAAGGSQCGYCTPGFVMSLFAEYYREGREGFDPEALSGNLCRCTGYRPIREAAQALPAPAQDDPFAARLREGGAPAPAPLMVGSGERFHRPGSLDELTRLLAAEPDARLIAGGTDLTVDVNQRGSRFPLLVSVDGVGELKRIRVSEDRLEIGAGVVLSQLEQALHGRLRILDDLLPLFASRLIRNRATLGGNLATASPIGDAAPALLALDATICLISSGGERELPLSQFFVGYRKTALKLGELIGSVRVPLPGPGRSRFYKVAKRHRDDISTVAAAFALDLDDEQRVSRVRLAFGGVAATPVRAYRTEAALVGQPLREGLVRAAATALSDEFQPISDHRGSASYRRALVGRLLMKFWAEEVSAWVR